MISLKNVFLICILNVITVTSYAFPIVVKKAPEESIVKLGYALSGIAYKAVCQVQAASENILVVRDPGRAAYRYLAIKINDGNANPAIINQGENTVVIKFMLNPAFDTNVPSYFTKFRDGDVQVENCTFDVDL